MDKTHLCLDLFLKGIISIMLDLQFGIIAIVMRHFKGYRLNLELGKLNNTPAVNPVKDKANHGNRIIQSKKARTAFMHSCYITAFN